MNLSQIPASTWEQFGLVILIFLGLYLVIGQAIRFVGSVKKIIDDTNLSFQKFLTEQRQSDHTEQQEREKAFADRNTRLVEMIEKVVERIEKLASSQDAHNTEMREAVADMRAKTTPARTRPK